MIFALKKRFWNKSRDTLKLKENGEAWIATLVIAEVMLDSWRLSGERVETSVLPVLITAQEIATWEKAHESRAPQ